MSGRFVIIYGIDGTGKTTIVECVLSNLQKKGIARFAIRSIILDVTDDIPDEIAERIITDVGL
jgi:predicted AAA+ superfamily ATPase